MARVHESAFEPLLGADALPRRVTNGESLSRVD
jgi:hypothetical protein